MTSNTDLHKSKNKPLAPKKLGTILLIAIILLIVILSIFFLLPKGQKSNQMQEGFYTAESADFDAYGWKEYVTIFVAENKIITIDYNAKNASGFIKSWDMEYMRLMNAIDGTYPNEYTRVYSEALLNRQDPDKVDVIAGATHSHISFQLLAKAAINQALLGDQNIIYIKLPEAEAEAEAAGGSDQ